MAADDLPTQFDVIVLGTGLLESILAAAFARVGHSVLHIDRNDYYCGDWASFNIHGLESWCTEQQNSHPNPLERPEADDVELKEGDVLVECPLYRESNSNIEQCFLVSDKDLEVTSEDESNKQVVGPCGDFSTTACDTPAPETYSEKANNSCHKQTQAEHSVTEHCTVSSDNIGSVPFVTETTSTREATPETSEESIGEIKQDGFRETEPCQSSTDSSVSNTGDAKADSWLCDSKHNSTNTSQLIPADQSSPKVWTKSCIEKEWRKFNIDLAPRLLYCRGDMVELLINSDVSKYCEFKTVTRVLTNFNGELQKVPCSRSDVFSSKSVSIIEKRMMMKFITFCMDYQKHPEEYQEFVDKPFTSFLDSRKLKPNVRHYIEHSIAMATDTTTTLEALEKTQKFILSLGRYGNTAFLWPLYGTGELPQSFARMCAVFGGIYCLRMTASSIIVDKENKYRGIVTTEGHRIESKWLISESSYLPEQYLPSDDNSRQTSRAVLMTDNSIHPEESEQLTLLHLPCPDDSNRPVTVLELGPSSMACPHGMYMVHLSRESPGKSLTSREDLQYAVDLLFSDTKTESKPTILWYLYFSQCNTEGLVTNCPDNIVTIPGPGSQLDMDHVVKQAQYIFAKLCPDEEFLPKAPNPEDIIFDDGVSREAGEGFHPPAPINSGDYPVTEGNSPDQEDTGGKSHMDNPPEPREDLDTVKNTDSKSDSQSVDTPQCVETSENPTPKPQVLPREDSTQNNS